MILRRVIARFGQLHWSAIGIDLAIVVLGVFIGMQVSNWNQQRATDQQSAVFTEHLKADLREEYWGYQLLIAYNGEVLSNAERAVDALDGTASVADEALLVAACRATQYKQRLRLRIADIETRVGDLTGNNRIILENLRGIVEGKPAPAP